MRVMFSNSCSPSRPPSSHSYEIVSKMRWNLSLSEIINVFMLLSLCVRACVRMYEWLLAIQCKLCCLILNIFFCLPFLFLSFVWSQTDIVKCLHNIYSFLCGQCENGQLNGVLQVYRVRFDCLHLARRELTNYIKQQYFKLGCYFFSPSSSSASLCFFVHLVFDFCRKFSRLFPARTMVAVQKRRYRWRSIIISFIVVCHSWPVSLCIFGILFSVGTENECDSNAWTKREQYTSKCRK